MNPSLVQLPLRCNMGGRLEATNTWCPKEITNSAPNFELEISSANSAEILRAPQLSLSATSTVAIRSDRCTPIPNVRALATNVRSGRLQYFSGDPVGLDPTHQRRTRQIVLGRLNNHVSRSAAVLSK